MRIKLLVAIAAFSIASPSVWAHHSFAAEFDPTKPVKLRGTVTQMEWINPHSWIHMDVKNHDGTVTVVLTWQPQSRVDIALVISALAIVACVVLVFVPARRRRRKRGGHSRGAAATDAAGDQELVGAEGFLVEERSLSELHRLVQLLVVILEEALHVDPQFFQKGD